MQKENTMDVLIVYCRYMEKTRRSYFITPCRIILPTAFAI